jgi:hypothetical protein
VRKVNLAEVVPFHTRLPLSPHDGTVDSRSVAREVRRRDGHIRWAPILSSAKIRSPLYIDATLTAIHEVL